MKNYSLYSELTGAKLFYKKINDTIGHFILINNTDDKIICKYYGKIGG